MLKTLILIFCFLGAALCFGQTEINGSVTREALEEIEVPVKGGSGGVDNDVKDPKPINQSLQPATNVVSISSSSSLIYKYSIYDMSNNLKTEQTIAPCPLYYVDISFLSSGNYKMITFTQDNQSTTEYFIK